MRRFPRQLPPDPVCGADGDRAPPLRRRAVAARRMGVLVAALRADRRTGSSRKKRRIGQAIIESFSELKGSLTLRGLPGGSFELTATADRIDRLASGGFLLIDYKTGRVPAKKAIGAGFAPQLPLEGADPARRQLRRGQRHPGGARVLEARRSAPAGNALRDRRWRATQHWSIARATSCAHWSSASTIPPPLISLSQYRQEAPRFSDYEHLERVGRRRGRRMVGTFHTRTAPGRPIRALRSGSRLRPGPARRRC